MPHFSKSNQQNLHMELANKYGAHNYHPLEVVLASGKGSWVTDVDGNKYLDMLSAYSAVNQGHVHPKLLATLHEQAHKMTLTSRAFFNDQMGPWLKELTEFCEMEMALPMNTGAEAVESAIKVARKWGYLVKGVESNCAEIIVCSNNFHGRTTTIVSFSTEPQYYENFGPLTPGFKVVPFGDVESLKKVISKNTVAFIVEPIQGEAGVLVPPEGYLKQCFEVCKENNVLFVADEIQTGLCRTGKKFCVDHENIKPDLLILGKALGGGFYPISALVGRADILGVLKPGDHGSTFGGNPLACAISRTSLQILQEEKLAENASKLGEVFRSQLRKNLPKKVVKEVRGKGLLNAIEVFESAGAGRFYSHLLAKNGLLAKETKSTTLRFAPPLVLQSSELETALQIITRVFSKTEAEWANA
jgi:ornithine--oxo-acid transaminase